MSPELDLLEYCSAEDITVQVALCLFSPDDPFNFSNVDRVRRVISIYVRQGFIIIKRRQENTERTLEPWQIRHVLEDTATWVERPDEEHDFLLSLTTAGWDAFVKGSQEFFDRLFGRRRG
jgi:hypothetical protein